MTAHEMVHPDHLGTPQIITDQNQNVVWEADYDLFGTATITTETITNNLRFPGQYFDAESNLHYNYFRDYDPSIGRYIESDPIGLRGGFNTYVYAIANPLWYTDPYGLDPWAGGSSGGRIDFIIGGYGARTGSLSNTLTGETCFISYRCLNLGFGALAALTAEVSFSVFRPKCGRELEGGGLTLTLDIVSPGAPGVSGSIDLVGAGVGAGIGPSGGAGIFVGFSFCYIRVLECFNTPCECK